VAGKWEKTGLGLFLAKRREGFGNTARGFGKTAWGFGDTARCFGKTTWGFGKTARGSGDTARDSGKTARGFGNTAWVLEKTAAFSANLAGCGGFSAGWRFSSRPSAAQAGPFPSMVESGRMRVRGVGSRGERAAAQPRSEARKAKAPGFPPTPSCGSALISRILCPRRLATPGCDHLSVRLSDQPAPACAVVRLLPGAIHPLRDLRPGGPFLLFCLAPHEVCRAPFLAVGAVGSYPAVSPLPCRSKAVCFL